jgi:hypothetical protein
MIITVTPFKAAEMIINNALHSHEPFASEKEFYEHYKSKESQKRIKQYAILMKKGKWKNTNDSPLIFFNDRHFFEGKHRLFAVMKSCTTQQFFAIKWNGTKEDFFKMRENSPDIFNQIIKEISENETDRFVCD